MYAVDQKKQRQPAFLQVMRDKAKHKFNLDFWQKKVFSYSYQQTKKAISKN